jgi:predicted outer membrane repeat protein
MKISKTLFYYNYAENGGAIYFGNARNYILEIGGEQNTFSNNLAYKSGDNLYVEEVSKDLRRNL